MLRWPLLLRDLFAVDALAYSYHVVFDALPEREAYPLGKEDHGQTMMILDQTLLSHHYNLPFPSLASLSV